jgi:hypothetical protein
MPPMNTRDRLGFHWLAGVLEGEGSFLYKNGSPCITVQMTDRDVIEAVAEMFGCPVQVWQPRGKDHYKQVFYARVHGTRAIEWMMTLYTLMHERRKAKIKEILTAWKASPAMPRASRGTHFRALCHPDLPRTGNGLCRKCYMRAWRAAQKESEPSPSTNSSTTSSLPFPA